MNSQKFHRVLFSKKITADVTYINSESPNTGRSSSY
jgi:hypothetical protein